MKLLLIGGIPSSGSTLLVYLLSQVSRFFCLPETGLFTQGRFFKSTYKELINPLYECVPWIDINAKTLQATGWEITQKILMRILFSILNSLKNHFKLHHNMVIVEKTPENIFAFEYYLKANSSRKVIVTLRDLESVCFSLMKRKFSMLEAIILWFAHAFEVWRLLKRYPDQIFPLYYDELCRNPKGCLLHIIDFFQIKVSSTNLANKLTLKASDHQWLLKQSSWNLSSRYWSKEIDIACDHKIARWLLGPEFDALIDSLAFKTPEKNFIKPRLLNMALQDKTLELTSTLSHKYCVIKVSNRIPLFDHLTTIYSPHLYSSLDNDEPF